MKNVTLLTLILASIHGISQTREDSSNVHKAFFHYGRAAAVYKSKDYNSYCKSLAEVHRQLPMHTGVIYTSHAGICTNWANSTKTLTKAPYKLSTIFDYEILLRLSMRGLVGVSRWAG